MVEHRAGALEYGRAPATGDQVADGGVDLRTIGGRSARNRSPQGAQVYDLGDGLVGVVDARLLSAYDDVHVAQGVAAVVRFIE